MRMIWRIVLVLQIIIVAFVFSDDKEMETLESRKWLNINTYSTEALREFQSLSPNEIMLKHKNIDDISVRITDNLYYDIDDIVYTLNFASFSVTIKYISYLDTYLLLSVTIKKSGVFSLWNIDIGAPVSNAEKAFGQSIKEMQSIRIEQESGFIRKITIYNLE